MSDVVLIVSSSDDLHAVAVQAIIKQRGLDARIWNSADFPTVATISHGIDNAKDSQLTSSEDWQVSASNLNSVWWRRPALSEIDPRIKKQSTRSFAKLNSRYALEGFFTSLPCPVINGLWAQKYASYKPQQLIAAKSIGMSIPRTIITNSPIAVQEFSSTVGAVIYKSLEKVIGEPDGTKLLRDDDLSRLDSLSLCPAIFQEYIEPEYDLRVTCVGNKIYAAKITSDYNYSRYDIRLDFAPTITEFTLPVDTEVKIAKLMRTLDLSFGALDFRVAMDGTIYFLEINPAGQWIYVEMSTQQPITDAMANLLIEVNLVKKP